MGFRLFAENSEKVKGFIIQNANAYMEGIGDAPKRALMQLWRRKKRTPETEKPAREFVSLENTKFHWLVGAKDFPLSTRTTGSWIRLYSTGLGCRTIRLICSGELQIQRCAVSRVAGRFPRAQTPDIDCLG